MHGAATLVVLGVLLLSPLPTAEATQGTQGLQDGWAVGDQGQVTGGQLLSDEVADMQQAGAGWVRVNFRLGQCFTNWTSVGCNGQTALQTYDQVLATIQARNLKVLGLLSSEAWPGQQSDWTANNVEHTAGGTGNNPYIQAFAQSAASVLASHYDGTNGPLVSQWEVWNEPNAWASSPSTGVYTGSSFVYPSNFAQILSQAWTAIKHASGTAVVVAGGLLGLDSSGTHKGAHNGYKAKAGGGSCPSTVPSGGDYLCSTYSMGWQYGGWTKGAGPFDAVGQHMYINQGTTTSTGAIQKYLNDLRKVYTTYGGDPSSKQTHVTEFGWSTGSVSPSVQAHNLQTAYQAFKGNQLRRAWLLISHAGSRGHWRLLRTGGHQRQSGAVVRDLPAVYHLLKLRLHLLVLR